MDAAVWIAIAGAAASPAAGLGGSLVAWGVMRGTLDAHGRRIAALERELGQLGELKLTVARVETRLDVLIEQFRELNASIGWRARPSHQPIQP